MWARYFERCVQCGETSYKHMAKGYCSSCYAKAYKQDPAKKQRNDRLKSEWYFKHHERELLRRKLYREQLHFAGQRDEVLERDGHECVDCTSAKRLVVHHKDHQGRGRASPNNDLSNLVTLCRKCHANAHREDLLEPRRKTGFRRSKGLHYKRKHKI